MKAATPLSAGLIFLLLFFVQGVFFIRANSPTYDEAMHLAAGYSYLATGDFRLEPQNPPLIKALLALPLYVGHSLPFNPDSQHWHNGTEFFLGQDFLYRSTLPADQMLAVSRVPNLFLGGILTALIGWWAYRLWGSGAAILAMALASLEPNLVSHSSLVTTDIGVTLFIFFAVYLLWEYLHSPRWWLLVATSISTGMALLSKFSALLLIPMFALIVALPLLIGGKPYLLPLRKNQNRLRHNLLQAAAVLSLILFFALLTIPPAYFFQGFQPWLSGFYEFLALAQVGQPAFFLGEYSYQGWWSYFLVAFLIKTPIGSLMLIAASLVFYRAGTPLGRREAVFLLVPVAIIFFATTQAKVNIGLRHVLPVYPFLFVLASRLATVGFRRHWVAPFLVGVPLVFTAVSSLRMAPHQLAYFNELVGGPDQGYRYLGDSNLDWGQDLKGVKTYMEKEKLPIIYLSYFGTAPPLYYDIRYQYVPGSWPLEWPPPADKVPAEAPRKILAISVCNLQDVSTPHNPLFRWLWIRQPVAKIGYSIFIYDLTDDREGLMQLEETYVKAGIGRSYDLSLLGSR
jgi:4-amino-4-deoxy-L-arabinose transferase-like glycosyltransferase